MATEAPGAIVPPNTTNADDYRQFLRSETASGLKPGSEEERLIIDGFQKARREQAIAQTRDAVGTREEPGPLAEELKGLEEDKGGYVTPEASRAAHSDAIASDITITKTEGQDGPAVPAMELPGPLETGPEVEMPDVSRVPVGAASGEREPL